jgi:hypothetical protein
MDNHGQYWGVINGTMDNCGQYWGVINGAMDNYGQYWGVINGAMDNCGQYWGIINGTMDNYGHTHGHGASAQNAMKLGRNRPLIVRIKCLKSVCPYLSLLCQYGGGYAQNGYPGGDVL